MRVLTHTRLVLGVFATRAVQEIAWADEGGWQADNGTEQVSDDDWNGDGQQADDDESLWTLAVSLFPPGYYPTAAQLVDQWKANFTASSQTP